MTLYKDMTRAERLAFIAEQERKREVNVWTHPERMARLLIKEYRAGRIPKALWLEWFP